MRTNDQHEGRDAPNDPLVDDLSIFCFFKKSFQPEILDSDIQDNECKFLVKLMDTKNLGKICYEE